MVYPSDCRFAMTDEQEYSLLFRAALSPNYAVVLNQGEYRGLGSMNCCASDPGDTCTTMSLAHHSAKEPSLLKVVRASSRPRTLSSDMPGGSKGLLIQLALR